MKDKDKAEMWKTMSLCESISYSRWAHKVWGLRAKSAQVGCWQAGSEDRGHYYNIHLEN